MRKILLLSAALLVSMISFTACAVPNIGEMEIVSAAKTTQIAADSPTKTDVAAHEPASAPSEPLSETEIDALVKGGIVPESAVTEENGVPIYDTQQITDALQKYIDRIECKTTMIGGNNMLVLVKNTNDLAIPTLTVHVFYPDGEKLYDFHQTTPGKEIAIPVDKGDGELPPAVSANVSVSMNNNQYTDISSALGAEETKTDSSYTLKLTNASAYACQKLSVTAIFSNDTNILYTEMLNAPQTISPNDTVDLTFDFPSELARAGEKFTNVSYTINEAVG
ncbi:MAG: hypothetical protein RSC25_06765 [Christensenella sp.]